MSEPTAEAVILDVAADPAARAARRALLERAGYAVFDAATGGEALARLDHTPVDVVLLGAELPDMSGPEAARRLRARLVPAAVAVLHAAAEARREGEADAWLAEPVAPETLLAAVQALVRIGQDRRRAREAAAALQESEQRYRGLFTAMSEGFLLAEMLYDEHGAPRDYRLLEVNPAFERLTGLPREEVLGRTVREVLQDVDESLISQLDRVVTTGEPVRFEYEVQAFGRRYETYIYSPSPGQFAGIFTDVTARRRDEREREELLGEMTHWRTLLDAVLHQMPTAVVVLDAAGRTVLANEEAQRLSPVPLTGSGIEIFRGFAIRHLDGTPYGFEEMPLIRALRRGEAIAGEEVALTTTEGEEILLSVSAVPLQDREGRITGAVALYHEVTAERRVQQEREQQARLLDALIENTDYWLAYLDRDLRFVHVNSAFAAKSPLTREEMIGKHYLEVFPDLQEAYQFYVQARDTGQPVSLQELPTTVPDHPEWGTVYLSFSIAPVKEADGSVRGVVFSAENVTEEVLSRQRIEAAERAWAQEAQFLDLILTNTDHWLAYLDRDLRFVRVNAAFANALRLDAEALIGRPFIEVFPSGVDLTGMLERVRDQGLPVRLRGLPRHLPRRRHREPIFVNLSVLPVTRDQTVEGIVISVVDVTAQTRQQTRLRAAERARAELAEHLNDEISHRVKNNLAMVSGLLYMQSVRQPSAEMKEILRDSISRIRTFANLHEQMYQTKSDTIDLLPALRRIVDSSREVFAGEEALEVTTEGESIACTSRAATNLSVVANELVTNALKHGGPGESGAREIEARVGIEEGRLVLSVWNSGNPVPEGFDPAAHSGMGLLLVLDLVTQYHGEFTLTPDRGGTLARIALDPGTCEKEPLLVAPAA